MKKLEMPKDYYSEKFDITIRPYVKAVDIVDIAENALLQDNTFEQEVCVAANVIGLCTDIDIDDTINDTDVDMYFATGLWDEVRNHVHNVHMIYDYIDKKQDAGIAIARFINYTLPELLEKYEKDLDKYIKHMPKQKDWDNIIKDFPESLQKALDAIEQSGNTDIVRGAMKMGEVQNADDGEHSGI